LARVNHPPRWLTRAASRPPRPTRAAQCPPFARASVAYRPDTERWSHYFRARLPDQFDALIHVDDTTALEPLDRSRRWVAGEAPETFPTGV
jgi:erythromycin esterase-like protein